MDDSVYQVVIVGGGISGLSAAYFLEKHTAAAGLDVSIDLIESRDRLGGVIVSERSEGFLVEGGPDSFLTQKTAAIDLCRELGIGDQLIPSNDQQRKTYILQGGALKELPDGLFFMLPTKVGPILTSDLFSFSGKLRLALSPLFSPPIEKDDVSVAQFVSKRLGREALERLAEPLLSAVYGADVNHLSAHAVLQRIVEMERKYGSLWKAVNAARRAPSRPAGNGQGTASTIFVSLRDGVGQLTNVLQQALSRTQFVTGTEITHVSRGASQWRVHARDGDAEAAAVIIATPAPAASRMLQQSNPDLAEQLNGVTYHSSMTVSLGYEEASFGRTLDGFGFVVPRGEGKRLVACTWVSTKFPFRSQPGRVLLRCFLGGARDSAITSMDDASVLEIVQHELRDIMGIRSQPFFTRIYRWDRAMPQYNVGHPLRVEKIQQLLKTQPGLFLAGNAYKGIGIPDCIDSAAHAAKGVIEHLTSLG
ncbi:MAG: protoporphyrinogen oxidase [Acidobacteria bacterium]|nr:protoporphyrinogen oxidase [Acidobacteriota bacterium]